jgi:hypothetical protein
MSTSGVRAAPADWYAILQIRSDAEPEVIEAAYRALARKYHPDVNRAAGADERIRAINEAYAVLHTAERRAAYDATRQRLKAAGGRMDGARQSDLEAKLRPARPVDLYQALVADVWRRALRRRMDRQGPPGREATKRTPGATTTWLLRLVVASAVLALLALSGWWLLAGRQDRAMRVYWQEAAAARAAVEASRQRYVEALGGGASYAVVAGNPKVPILATQLGADLEDASGRLRRVGQVPKAAEEYHLAQLNDWREEYILRLAYRDALTARNPDLWNQTAEREAAWRSSPLHQRVEALAWSLASLATKW